MKNTSKSAVSLTKNINWETDLMSKYRITLNSEVYEMEVELIEEGSAPVKTVAAPAVRDKEPSVAQKAPAQTDNTSVDGAAVSPMPGTVVRLMAAQGDKVCKGQPILVLEAMKMENEITAAKDGVLSELRAAEGQTVAGGGILFVIS